MRTFFIFLFFLSNYSSRAADINCFPHNITSREILSLSRSVAGPLVLNPKVASDILINIYYQNCYASNLPPYDILERGEMQGYALERHPWNGGSASKVVDIEMTKKSQYYIRCDEEKSKGCIDLCKTPPTYIWGGKGKYSKGGEVDIFSNEKSIQDIANHPGIDCSGFINAVFATAGLKVRTDMKNTEVASLTPASWFMEDSTCFDILDAGSPLMPGDLISWRKHIVMVDEKATDPFAIGHIKSHKDCTSKYINPLEMKLVVSNSLGGINDENKDKKYDFRDLYRGDSTKGENIPFTGVGIGVSKIPLGHLALKYPSQIMELAKTACLAKFGKEYGRSKIQVSRHKLANVKKMPRQHECLESMEGRIKVKGIECLTKNCKF